MTYILIALGVVALCGVIVWVCNLPLIPPDDPYFLERGEVPPRYDLDGAGAPYDQAQQEAAIKKRDVRDARLSQARLEHTDPVPRIVLRKTS